MTPGDAVTPRPDADDLLAGLDPELADVARRLVDDAHGHVPGDAFAARLAGELRAANGAGAPGSPAGSSHTPAPDDLGRSLPQPPLWAKVAVGILSLTLVYGLIASVFRPKSTPPVEVPAATSTAPASETPAPVTVSASPSPSPTASSTPTPTPTTRRSGAAAHGLEATPIALPTATRTLAPSAVPTPTDMHRAAMATATPTRRPTVRPTVRPSDTPVPAPTTVPSHTPVPSATTKPHPSENPPPTAHPTEVEASATPTPHAPDTTPTPVAQPTTSSDACVEACTRKSVEWYRECVDGGGSAEDCLRRSNERRSECIRAECGPTPVAGG